MTLMPIMKIPLERKRRPDRPKATTNALTRQPNETQNVNDLGISAYEESDSDDPPFQEQLVEDFCGILKSKVLEDDLNKISTCLSNMDPKVVQDHAKTVRSRRDIIRRHGVF
ncbi:hypothetical protein BpHYR1_020982 [Brachionus plicatilis]|uniref:Uncharacterized protein n=1 Tax=Brachionus plicatilis TaxID=10195 RepID=A0A3M7T1E8_BRAPC|nr:hypothetical protein BpHYR1_020982 [Brachionus plicatilis]